MGIEPTYPAWKAGVLPLNYTRIKTNLYFPDNAQNRNRTSDTRIFSPLLYQLSYLGSLRNLFYPLKYKMSMFSYIFRITVDFSYSPKV